MKKLLITMGDPSGIGPEIVLKFYSRKKELDRGRALLVTVGTARILKEYIDRFNMDMEIQKIESLEEAENYVHKDGVIPVIDIDTREEVIIGKVSEESGKLSMLYLEKAVELCKNGVFDGMVTAPISKDAINLAGYKYSGHTTFLAHSTGTMDFAMVLKGKKVVVLLNTTHLSILDAVKRVKKDHILKKIVIAQRAKDELGLVGPIAVAGLNPHNGENGLFGTEEMEEIGPAIEEAKRLGIEVVGPVVPDTLFVKVLKGEYAISVVMYHDQGLIPMKMESFGMGVNITIGLPFVRTSVDHGTAFEIAGKGVADEGSLFEAVKMAIINLENRGVLNGGTIKI